ncbi:hypothetical protein HDU93_007435 [Gonapodya sp. JEL0774]|nr:hypothetical protein HDU93_007435 [Gonapodya sp. JEL0774]
MVAPSLDLVRLHVPKNSGRMERMLQIVEIVVIASFSVSLLVGSLAARIPSDQHPISIAGLPFPPESTIGPECYAAIHDHAFYRRISQSCLPHGAWLAGLDVVTAFKSVITFGTSDYLMRQLYAPGGPYGGSDICRNDRIALHHDTYCSDDCASTFTSYFQNLQSVCGSDRFIGSKGNYSVQPPPYRDGSYQDFESAQQFYGQMYPFGEEPPCNFGQGPFVAPSSTETTEDKRPRITSFLSHFFTGFLLDSLDRSKDLTAGSFAGAFEITRAAVCIKVPQTGETTYSNYCPLEARQIVGPAGYLAAEVPDKNDPARTKLVIDEKLLQSYYGSAGREYKDACACSNAILDALPTTNSPLRPSILTSGRIFRDAMCSSTGKVQGTKNLYPPSLPSLTPSCVAALHNTDAFKKVAHVCVPSDAVSVVDDPAGTFISVLVQGTNELTGQGIYAGDMSQFGDVCYRDLFDDLNDKICSNSCLSVIDKYLDNVELACAGQAFRGRKQASLGDYFRGRRQRSTSPFDGGLSMFYMGPDGCENRRRDLSNAGAAAGQHFFIKDHHHAAFRNLPDDDGEVTVDTFLPFGDPHRAFAFLFQLMNEASVLYPEDLRTAYRISRAAICTQVTQSSDFWEDWGEEDEGYCMVEAWKFFGGSFGRMPQLFDGTKTGWGMRPGREGAVLGMWPLFRKDADSCAW